MAPVVSLADDIERLSACVAGLARVALAGKLHPVHVEKSAASAGLSAEQARAFLRGEVTLPSRQSVAFVSAVLEASRIAQVSAMEALRGGHAGANLMGASYAEKMPEKLDRRGRITERAWARGGPLEATAADVEATLARLRKDFPGCRFDADGIGSLAAGRAKLIWRARHAGGSAVSGVTSLEVAEKLMMIDADLAEDDRRAAAYARG